MALLGREIDRVVDRLRSLGPNRLAAGGAVVSVADEAHRLAQLLADAAAGFADEDRPDETRRNVPRLGDHAVADQVAVTGRDLLDALAARRAVPPPAVMAAVAELKRSLP